MEFDSSPLEIPGINFCACFSMIVVYTDVFEHFAVPQLKHLAAGEIFWIGEVVENEKRGFWTESWKCVPGRRRLVADELFTWE